MRLQSRRWIASHERVELNVRRTQYGEIGDGNTIRILRADGARNDRVVEVHGEVLILESCQVGPALKLQDARDLPAIHETAHDLVRMDLGQFDGVCSVKEVRPIVWQHAIIVAHIEFVDEVMGTRITHDP